MQNLFYVFILVLFLNCDSTSGDQPQNNQENQKYIYVCDVGNYENPPWKIMRYDLDGKNPKVFINTNLAQPQDIIFLDDQNAVLISNFNTKKITKYNAKSGSYLGDFATGFTDGPTRMKIGPDSLLYVLQWSTNGTAHVIRFQLDGTNLGAFTSVGQNSLIGIDWDSAGNLYLSSFYTAIVHKYDTNGVYLNAFINSNLVGPTNIIFVENGSLLVLDYNGAAVKKFSSSGEYIGVFISGISESEGITRLENGSFLIGDGGNNSVKQYDSNGNFLKNIVSSGSGGLIQPNAVIIH